jgi:hypothetical protein
MIKQMAQVAIESVREPNRHSIWHAGGQRYVCPRDPEYKEAIREQSAETSAAHPAINPAFKLVFLTAAGGTLLFVLICLGMHVALGEKMPPATVKLVDGFFAMAQIGFGAVVGLLGGQVLRQNLKP